MLVGRCVNTMVLTRPHFLAICGATIVLIDVITKKLVTAETEWAMGRLVPVRSIAAVWPRVSHLCGWGKSSCTYTIGDVTRVI